MTADPTGRTLFERGDYQRALEEFKICHQKNPTIENMIRIGKCYFHLKTVETYTYHSTSYMGSFPTRRPRMISYTAQGLRERHHLDSALVWFSNAAIMKADSEIAHFWKGRTLEKLEKFEEAYDAFHIAANLDPKYLKKCQEIFDQHTSVKGHRFLTYGDNILDLLSSTSSFDRMQGCWKVIDSDRAMESEAVASSISLLQGKIYCGIHICCTGDSDSRVRNLAHRILQGALNVHDQ